MALNQRQPLERHTTLADNKAGSPVGPDRHLPWIDWLRFLAALVVLATHLRTATFVEFGALQPSQHTAIVAGLFAATRIGNEAVILFFVLSGYLVAGRTLERIVAGEFRVGDYVIDRISRIYMPYVPALVFSGVAATLVGHVPSLREFLVNLFCLQGVLGAPYAGNDPLWSIAYEVWFYILAGSIGAMAIYRVRPGVQLLAAAALLIAALCIFSVLSAPYLFCWIIGGMAYFIRSERWWILVAGAVLAALSVIGLQLRFDSVSVATSSWHQYLPPTDVLRLLLGTAAASIICQLVRYRPTSVIGKRLDNLGTRLAGFSYTLYLVHYAVLRAAAASAPKENAVTFRAAVHAAWLGLLALGVSFGMYMLFERNTRAVRSRLRSLWAGTPARSF